MILRIENVTKEFKVSHGPLARASHFTALKDVSLSVAKGESFGLVGESGSGKTTLTRLILQLDRATSGRILFDGVDLASSVGPQSSPSEVARPDRLSGSLRIAQPADDGA